MKYRNLLGSTNKDIYGSKFIHTSSTFVHRDSKLTIIHGLPDCPECKAVLDKDWWNSKWVCKGCGTVWDSVSLLQAIETESKLMEEISVRRLQ